MTTRDPNNTEFIRKSIEFYDCVSRYYKISNETKLASDLNRKDIDLVCNYELKELKDHIRNRKGLFYNDLIKLTPQQDRELDQRLLNLK